MAWSSNSDVWTEHAGKAQQPGSAELDRLLTDIAACRICVEAPSGAPLPHAPRPVLRPSATARVCIAGQAPGTRVHATGLPFTDRSGDRLRDWLGLDAATFYDQTRVAIVPMGFCFPGLNGRGGDLPPRPECARAWRSRLFGAMPQLELILLVGSYAQSWHSGERTRAGMTQTVASWREQLASPHVPRMLALPHPSWRNNAWLRRNAWFEAETVPALRLHVARLTERAPQR